MDATGGGLVVVGCGSGSVVVVTDSLECADATGRRRRSRDWAAVVFARLNGCWRGGYHDEESEAYESRGGGQASGPVREEEECGHETKHGRETNHVTNHVMIH